MIGVDPPRGVYTPHHRHRHRAHRPRTSSTCSRTMLRTPSGVSYMLENRETMMQLFPELFQRIGCAPVENYPQLLRQTLAGGARRPAATATPTIAVLTPGIYNSRLFRARLPRRPDGRRAGRGPGPASSTDGTSTCARPQGRERDRRALPPRRRRLPRSADLQPGLRCSACRASWMSTAPAASRIANAPGTGIADDKAIYTYMPEIIEFYTGEKPILQNVPTWRCAEPDELSLRARASDRAGGQGSARLGRLRHAGRPDLDAGARSRTFRRQARWRGPTTTSRSRRWRSRPARPSSRRASRRAMSTCGPSCWSATASTSCRAG